MAQVLNNSVFPLHKNTFQGIAVDELMDNKPYKIVHADGICVLSVLYEDGGTPVVYNLISGEDVSIATGFSVSSDVSIKIS